MRLGAKHVGRAEIRTGSGKCCCEIAFLFHPNMLYYFEGGAAMRKKIILITVLLVAVLCLLLLTPAIIADVILCGKS